MSFKGVDRSATQDPNNHHAPSTQDNAGSRRMPVSSSSSLNNLPKSATSAQGISPEAMAKFTSGFKRFHRKFFSSHIDLFSALQKGQAPKTLLIGCSDSRCDPAIVTDCDPGDIFVIRNVANIVPPYADPKTDTSVHGASAAIEYAVKALKVENIVIMGHSKCGGIAALMGGVPAGMDFIEPWIRIASKAKERTLEQFADSPTDVQQKCCEHASILCSMEHLTTFPWILERLQKGELTISGWYFDFMAGELTAYDPNTNTFEAIGRTDAEGSKSGLTHSSSNKSLKSYIPVKV